MRNPPPDDPSAPTPKRRRYETLEADSSSNLSTFLGQLAPVGPNGYSSAGNGGAAGVTNRDQNDVAPASGNVDTSTFPATPYGRPGSSYSNVSLPLPTGGYVPPASNPSPNYNSSHPYPSAYGGSFRSRLPKSKGPPAPTPPDLPPSTGSNHVNPMRVVNPLNSMSLHQPSIAVPIRPIANGASMPGMPHSNQTIYRHPVIPSSQMLPPLSFPHGHIPTNNASRIDPVSDTGPLTSVYSPNNRIHSRRLLSPFSPSPGTQPSRSLPAPTGSRTGPYTRSLNPVSRAMNSAHNVSSESLSIRQMVHVVAALALLRDETPMMTALTQTVLQKGKLPFPQHLQREKILSFKGFPRGSTPQTNFLTALSKSDLDILAWVFDVRKNGRKEEVARRIIEALTMPLKFIIPHPNKRPHIPHRLEVRTANSQSINATDSQRAPGGQPATHATSSLSGWVRHGFPNNPPTLSSPGARSNMPSFTTSTGASRTNAMQNLTRQLEATSPAVAPDLIALPTAADPSGSANAPRGLSVSRNRKTQLECQEVLKSQTFMEGENEFNEPLNGPLGEEKFVFFTSAQLTRGTEDPVLKFVTPPSITPLDCPKVSGGEVQIHLRCLRVEVDKPPLSWKQSWPFPASCRVNGHGVTLNQAQRYTNGKLAGRDGATNISPYLRKHSNNAQKSLNKITLRRQPSSASSNWGQFVLFAQEILIYSHETMTKNVSNASEKYWQEHYVALLEKKEMAPNSSDYEMAKLGVVHFLNDPDGLMVSSMKVSLRCPLALTRIVTPVKGRKCQHVQCFDLDTFLHFSRRSSKFECPVCNKATAQPSKLIISPYIQHALQQFGDCDEVEITKTGDMVAVERKQTGVASDDEEMSDGGKQPNGDNEAPRATNTSHMEVVDLTLDSDDEGNAGRTPAEGNNEAEANPFTDVDQEDIDFTFHADTTHYGRAPNHSENQDTGHPANWSCDVIAIDSD